MFNELLWLIEIPVNFLLILLAYCLFGKKGLYLWIPVSVIVANIQVVMALRLFGLSATLGNVSYAASFLVTDILSEKYGKKDARRAVLMGLFCLVAATILFQLTLLFQPLPGDEFASEVHAALGTIFGLMPRIALGSLTAYFISQWHDVWAFDIWRKRFPHHLWIRNNCSTIVSQLIDSAVFVLIAFAGVYPAQILFEIFITTFVLKFLVAIADTPFLYWARRIHPIPVTLDT